MDLCLSDRSTELYPKSLQASLSLHLLLIICWFIPGPVRCSRKTQRCWDLDMMSCLMRRSSCRRSGGLGALQVFEAVGFPKHLSLSPLFWRAMSTPSSSLLLVQRQESKCQSQRNHPLRNSLLVFTFPSKSGMKLMTVIEEDEPDLVKSYLCEDLHSIAPAAGSRWCYYSWCLSGIERPNQTARGYENTSSRRAQKGCDNLKDYAGRWLLCRFRSDCFSEFVSGWSYVLLFSNLY